MGGGGIREGGPSLGMRLLGSVLAARAGASAGGERAPDFVWVVDGASVYWAADGGGELHGLGMGEAAERALE
jgi:hypothetical protein